MVPGLNRLFRLGCASRHPKQPKKLDRFVISMVFDIYLTTGNPNIGKAFHIRDTIKGRYFYPREPGMSSTDLRMKEKYDALRPPPVSLFRDTVRLVRFMVRFTSVEPLTLTTLTSDGQGEISNKSRPLKPGEVGEWILLDGVSPTPRISHLFR
jgi:hypothetical protein